MSETAVNEGAEVFTVACGDSWIGAPVEQVEYEAQHSRSHSHSVSIPDNLEHQVSHVSSLKLEEGNGCTIGCTTHCAALTIHLQHA